MDFYMLAVTLLVESDKTISRDSYYRIRGGQEHASHALVVAETDKIADEDLKQKVKALLSLALDDGI